MRELAFSDLSLHDQIVACCKGGNPLCDGNLRRALVNRYCYPIDRAQMASALRWAALWRQAGSFTLARRCVASSARYRALARRLP